MEINKGKIENTYIYKHDQSSHRAVFIIIIFSFFCIVLCWFNCLVCINLQNKHNMAPQQVSLVHLPTEIQLIIYQYVLCLPESMVITCACFGARNRRLHDCGEPKVRTRVLSTTPSVTTSLTQVCHSIYLLAMECLYKKKIFIFDTSCLDALHFLKCLNPDARNMIKNIYLTNMVSTNYRQNWVTIARDLTKLLSHMSSLREIAVSMPDDRLAGSMPSSYTPVVHVWGWYVQIGLCKALFAGHFDRIRFVHPRVYSHKVGPYGYWNVKTYLRGAVLNPCVTGGGYSLNEYLQAPDEEVWRDCGFVFELDKPRPWEEGSVLVLQPVRG